MSYTVLARRYRSGTFDEVIGQDHVAQTLKKAIASGRIAHAYLFCGTRGVGKTSMARILAKALNCQASEKPTTEPCGKCESCKGITRGDDIDVLEIDAASNTGVDNVREVIENSRFSPAHSRFKIYIIDEAHMLSKAAFNALLKTLEEPPGHVKFILATTEAEKLLPTILSRCQRYDFRNIPTREIAGHLAELCKKEKIKADEDALLLVAKAGAGSMRDSLSLLDRLLSVGEKHLTADMIEQMLGLPKSQLLFDLAGTIASGDVKSALGQVNTIVQGGLSVDSLIAALVDHLRNLLILRTCGADSTLVEVPGLAMADLMSQAEQFDAGALAQDITILEELRRTLRQSQAGRALLDATLVRMTLADQFASIGELIGRVNGAPSSPSPARTSAPRPIAVPVQSSAPVQKKNAELTVAEPAIVAPVSVSNDDDDDDALPAVGKVWSGPSESLATLMARHRAETAPAPSPAEPLAASPIATVETDAHAPASDNLPLIRERMLGLLSEDRAIHSAVSLAQVVGVVEGRLVLRYAHQHETFVRLLEKNGKKEKICDAVSKVLNQNVGVRFEIDAAVAVAPVVQGPVASFAKPQAAAAAPAPVEPPTIKVTQELVESLAGDNPLIKQIMQRLGGQVIKVE